MLAANDVTVLRRRRDGYTPTPGGLARDPARQPRGATAPAWPTASWSRRRTTRPRDGGFKYNPPHGGPADTDATRSIAARANELIAAGLDGVQRIAVRQARAAAARRTTSSATYVDDLPTVLDLDAIRDAGVRIGADPLGGASVDYWGEIAERHGLDLTVVNPLVDPTWRFMTLDWDGKIRMDCSSPNAMASLIARKDELRRSPPATTPTPTGTASSPPTPG